MNGLLTDEEIVIELWDLVLGAVDGDEGIWALESTNFELFGALELVFCSFWKAALRIAWGEAFSALWLRNLYFSTTRQKNWVRSWKRGSCSSSSCCELAILWRLRAIRQLRCPILDHAQMLGRYRCLRLWWRAHSFSISLLLFLDLLKLLLFWIYLVARQLWLWHISGFNIIGFNLLFLRFQLFQLVLILKFKLIEIIFELQRLLKIQWILISFGKYFLLLYDLGLGLHVWIIWWSSDFIYPRTWFALSMISRFGIFHLFQLMRSRRKAADIRLNLLLLDPFVELLLSTQLRSGKSIALVYTRLRAIRRWYGIDWARSHGIKGAQRHLCRLYSLCVRAVVGLAPHGKQATPSSFLALASRHTLAGLYRLLDILKVADLRILVLAYLGQTLLNAVSGRMTVRTSIQIAIHLTSMYIHL